MTEPTNAVPLSDLIAQGEVEAGAITLDQTAKEQLAEAGTPFTITDIAYGDDGEYKPYYQFSIICEGKVMQFRLSTNEHRDMLIVGLTKAVAQHPVSGVRLRAIGTRGGNKFLTLSAV